MLQNSNSGLHYPLFLDCGIVKTLHYHQEGLELTLLNGKGKQLETKVRYCRIVEIVGFYNNLELQKTLFYRF